MLVFFVLLVLAGVIFLPINYYVGSALLFSSSKLSCRGTCGYMLMMLLGFIVPPSVGHGLFGVRGAIALFMVGVGFPYTILITMFVMQLVQQNWNISIRGHRRHQHQDQQHHGPTSSNNNSRRTQQREQQRQHRPDLEMGSAPPTPATLDPSLATRQNAIRESLLVTGVVEETNREGAANDESGTMGIITYRASDPKSDTTTCINNNNDDDDTKPEEPSANNNDHVHGHTECAICLEKYQHDDKVCWSSNPDCHHAFHMKCALEWLETQTICPVCRRPYLQP